MLRWLIIIVFLSCSVNANDNVLKFGKTHVHYSVINTEFLKPEIASRYGITRGANQGFVNINVQNVDSDAGEAKAVKADISGKFKNLRAQEAPLDFKEFKEGDAIYYIATFRFDHKDILSFELDVKAASSDKSNKVKFQHEMYAAK